MSNYGTFKYKGMPIYMSDSEPSFGDVYFVNGATGIGAADGNTGLTPNKPKKTIQGAVTAQIANTQGFGDTIYVAPGTYAESITGNLSACKLIGYRAFSVRVSPTASHAYSGNLHDATISGLMFDSPSSSNTDYAALRFTTVQDSVIENNLIGCKVNVANSVGVMFGPYATAATTSTFHRSKFRKNQILANGGNQVFDYGFVMGSGSGDATNANSRTMWNSIIEDNIICAEHQGIRLIANYAGNYGSVIRRNVISGDAANHGETDEEGIYFLDDTNTSELAKIWVIDNRISSDSDGIKGFEPQLTQGNIVGVGGVGSGAPAGETGFAS